MIAMTAAAGCKADGFELGAGGGGGGGGDGGMNGDASSEPDARPPFDAGPMYDAEPSLDACPVSAETCDGEDNDCDGVVDENFLPLETNPAYCGECNNPCILSGAAGTCVYDDASDESSCEFECLPGFHNLDTSNPDCEYQCVPTNGGVEICDFADNDCNGQIDEGFNLDTDESNCGGCGIPCNVLNAEAECTGGMCGFSNCLPGYSDVLSSVAGCEYTCPEPDPDPDTSNPGPFPADETACDGRDEDCDGTIDEGTGTGAACVPRARQTPCEPDCTGTDICVEGSCVPGDTGECNFGAQACQNNTDVCQGFTGPSSEVCDGADNDCDGTADDGFDFDNDEANCGSCGNVCDIPNAIPVCTNGGCEILACRSGWFDSDGDGDPVEGCDYQCTPSGPEVCDGIDNDCDRLVDADDDQAGNFSGDTAFQDVSTNFCRQQGECAGTTPSCSSDLCGGPVQWRCVYDENENSNLETDGCGNLVLQEQRCDDLNNDCDANIDEAHQLKNTACSDDELGACESTGLYDCNAAGDALVCDIDNPGATPVAETCNGLDDDCDGELDEDAPDEMAAVTIDDDGDDVIDRTFYIYSYEASRPGASSASPGTLTHRSCSNDDTLPWRLVSHSEADAACAATGKRLCTEAEWQRACETTAGFTYPYGDDYDAQICNGRDYDTDPVANGNQDAPVPTGSLEMCVADWSPDGGAYDMSGNVKEWTSEMVATDTFRVRGGSYDNIEPGLTCQFDFLSFDQEVELPNLGFRCCADMADPPAPTP